MFGSVLLTASVVDEHKSEAGNNQHNEERDNLEGDFTLFFKTQDFHLLAERDSTDLTDNFGGESADIFNSCWHFSSRKSWYINDVSKILFTEIRDFNSGVLIGVVDVLIVGDTMVVLGCCLSSDLVTVQIKLNIQVREHLFILQTGVRPHLFESSLLLKSLFELLQQLLHTWFVLGRPLNLASLLLGDSLIERA
jgi:hypothetical protein